MENLSFLLLNLESDCHRSLRLQHTDDTVDGLLQMLILSDLFDDILLESAPIISNSVAAAVVRSGVPASYWAF